MSVSPKIIKMAIVEDDKYFNKVLTRYLENVCNSYTYPGLVFDIVSYFDAHSCIEELDSKIDILILDFYLYNESEGETLTALDILNEIGTELIDCKIILVSTQEDNSIKKQLFNAGIYAYVDKNVSTSNRVGAVVQQILKNVA